MTHVIGCVQNDIWAYGTFSAKPCTYLTSTLTPSPNRPNKIPHDPRHLGVPSGASKMIYEPMVRLAKLCTHLTQTLTPPNGPNEIPHDPHHLGVPSGASKMISEPMVHLAQTVHISYINTNTISKWTEWDSTRPMSPRSSICCVQNNIWANGTFSTNRAPILLQH